MKYWLKLSAATVRLNAGPFSKGVQIRETAAATTPTKASQPSADLRLALTNGSRTITRIANTKRTISGRMRIMSEVWTEVIGPALHPEPARVKIPSVM